MSLHKILCKSRSDQAKGSLQSKQNMGFPLNYHSPSDRDAMRAAGVNAFSARGKILREEIQLREFSVREHYRKLVGNQVPILTRYAPDFF